MTARADLWKAGWTVGEPHNVCPTCDGAGEELFEDEDGGQTLPCSSCDGTGIDRGCVHCGAIGEWNDNAGDYLCGGEDCYLREIAALTSDRYLARRLKTLMLRGVEASKAHRPRDREAVLRYVVAYLAGRVEAYDRSFWRTLETAMTRAR